MGGDIYVTTTSHPQETIRRPRSTRAFFGGLAVISAAALAACSGSPNGTVAPATPGTSTAAALPGLGVELAASQIPWNQVGPGWMLATWSPAPGLRPGEEPPAGQPRVAPLTLYLLDPAGGRYAITTFPVEGAKDGTDFGQTPTLADWSGDGRHALFMDQGTNVGGKFQTTMTDIDLTTGTKQTFTVPGAQHVNPFVSAEYTRPTGQAVLLSTTNAGNGPQTSTLKRIDLSGHEQLTYPSDLGAAGKASGGYLELADGTQLVFGTSNGLVMVGNDGVVGKPLPVPGVSDCSPVQPWTSTVILARCDIGEFPDSASQLWQVPLDGGAPTALTAPNSGQQDSGFGQDLGDGNAWQLPSGTFLQSAGACGSMFLSRLTPDGHTTKVTVPGVDSSVLVAGATADELVLMAKLGCGANTSLLAYDPAANTSTVLLGPPVNGGGVKDALLYPEGTS
jgi:hypothetical protein